MIQYDVIHYDMLYNTVYYSIILYNIIIIYSQEKALRASPLVRLGPAAQRDEVVAILYGIVL